MTGTALTEKKEFAEIYHMEVIEIPTNKPVARIDHVDSVYKTKQEKYNAVVEDVLKTHSTGQPVLVGTASIDVSEEISKLLTEKGIRHQVLNAKNHESEAEIVSHAGEKGAVTIATNMAGRGTDIKLGEGVTELGGLKIIGTERHESMRIDNQLRGRAGRQGDPGESKFYLSLEDDLMRLFGYDKFKKIYEVYKIPEGEDIQDKSVAKQIRRAQKDKENNNFGIRKNLLDYDAVNNQQREIIYAERRRVLNGESMRDLIYDMIRKVVEDDVLEATGGSIKCMDVDTFDTVLNRLREDVPIGQVTVSGEELNDVKKLLSFLQEESLAYYHLKEKEFDSIAKLYMQQTGGLMSDGDKALCDNGMREVERIVLLNIIDRNWPDQIDNMDKLRESISLQAYAQRDPVTQYKLFGCEMFEEMAKHIRHDTVSSLMHFSIEQKVERESLITEQNEKLDETKRVLAEVVRNIKTAAEKQHKEKQRVISLSAFSTFVQVHRDLLEYNQLFLLRRYTVCLFWIKNLHCYERAHVSDSIHGIFHSNPLLDNGKGQHFVRYPLSQGKM